MRAIAVQPNDAANWKEALSWHFSSFCRDGSISPEQLWAEVEAKARQLWVLEVEGAVKAAILTQIFAGERRFCSVTHAAGEDRGQWQHLWPALEHWAREIGCDAIKATCRTGWEPHLRQFGLRKTHVVLEKALA